MLQCAPSWRRPAWCISSGRDPMASPPGSATLARLHRPTRGPSTQTEARNCRTAAKSASYFGSSGDVMRTVAPSNSTVAPRPRNTSAINGTSRMSGQLVIVLVPSANSVAAISFRTLFLAPPTATSPDNRLPPVTTKRSATRASLVKPFRPVSPLAQLERYLFIHGSTSDPHLYPDWRRRNDGVERFLTGFQKRHATGGVCRLRRGQCGDRHRDRPGKPDAADSGSTETDPERSVRRRRGSVDAGRGEPGASTAAHHAALRRPP